MRMEQRTARSAKCPSHSTWCFLRLSTCRMETFLTWSGAITFAFFLHTDSVVPWLPDALIRCDVPQPQPLIYYPHARHMAIAPQGF